MDAAGTVRPFTELAAHYRQLQQAAATLVQACHAAQVDLSAVGLAPGMQLNAAALSAEQAAGFAGAIPTAAAEVAAAQHRLAVAAAQAQQLEAHLKSLVSKAIRLPA